MNTKPYLRLHLFFAADNDRAVILRQASSKLFNLILWHRDTDTFEDGQWLKNKVYVDRCDLSPDGRHFIYFALSGDWRGASKGAFSAISRPPYFTALALFPQGHTWGGGGTFLDNRHYFASGDADIVGRDEGLARVTVGEPTKDCRTGLRLQNGQRAPIDRAATRRLLPEPIAKNHLDLHSRMPVPRPGLQDRYDTMGGKLYHRRGDELELIRDFTDMTFENIRAPYDWRGYEDHGETTPWHPLD